MENLILKQTVALIVSFRTLPNNARENSGIGFFIFDEKTPVLINSFAGGVTTMIALVEMNIMNANPWLGCRITF